MRSLEPTGGEDQRGSKICSADEDRGHGNQIPSENIGEGQKRKAHGRTNYAVLFGLQQNLIRFIETLKISSVPEPPKKKQEASRLKASLWVAGGHAAGTRLLPLL